MLTRRPGLLLVPVLALTMSGIAGCGDSGSGTDGGLSLADKAKTVQVCVDVAGVVQSAAAAGAKVGQGSITEAEAKAELQPIASRVKALATDNASLPIGKGLRHLSDVINGLQKVSAKAPADAQAAITSLETASKAVVDECAAIGS